MDENEEIVTYSELLDQIDDEEAELDRERALYGNCDVDTCTYAQVSTETIRCILLLEVHSSGICQTTSAVCLYDLPSEWRWKTGWCVCGMCLSLS